MGARWYLEKQEDWQARNDSRKFYEKNASNTVRTSGIITIAMGV
jgi:hypothetical protein